MAKNDVLLYGGLTIVGLYAVYVLSRNLNKAASGAANIPVAAGNLALTTSTAAGDVLTKTGSATSKVITTTGGEVSEVIEGVGGTLTNITDLAQAATRAPLTIFERLNKAYEDIAPIDWLKHKILG